jgi:DNA-cytosine methyltransferase
MKVLSLFDGMSCGQIALSKLGFKVDKYYASEIDKYAIEITQKNFPNTIQLGDVCQLDPKDFMDVDLIQAGSPCQGFSFAGAQLAFDDPRSALFFEFIRLLKEIGPKYFLLENVRMKKEFLEVITDQVSSCYTADDVDDEYVDMFGNVRFEPHFINSSLLSAQSRQRYYWTNIPNIKQPEDKGIVLRDILETEPKSITKMSDKFVKRNGDKNCMIDQNREKAHNLSAEEYVKNGRQGNYLACDDEGKPAYKPVKKTERNRKHLRQPNEKSLCMTATMYKGAGNNGMTLVPTKPKQVGLLVEKVRVRKHEVDVESLQNCLLDALKKSGKSKKQVAGDLNDKFSTVEHYFRKVGSESFSIPSEEHWPQLKDILDITTDTFDKSIMEFEVKDGVYESSQRVYSEDGKSPTITSVGADKIIETKPKQVGIAVDIKGHDILKRVYSPEGKSPTITTMGGGHREPKVVTGGAMRAKSKNKDGKHVEWKETKPQQMLELRKDEKSNSISTVSKDSLVVEDEMHWRKLTPLECERLQTVPDGYTEGVSNTQRYRMLGNGWTVDVIAHIYKNMEVDET